MCDNEVLELLVKNRGADGIVRIPPRKSETDPRRDYWLLDRAVLLPENTTVILQNCSLKLSDRCRDNFFRTANCGLGIEDPAPIRNIHIRGEGHCVLEGADHPRATGDGTKLLADPCPYLPEDLCKYAHWIPAERRTPEKLAFSDFHDHSYGTDIHDPGESHMGDWRGIGILFANTADFSIENLHIAHSHGWGISLEACRNGRICNISFEASMSKTIDGMAQNMENQDGIDIRNGCSGILIQNITGKTGDDVIALTAIAEPEYRPGGSLCSTHVMHSDWARRDPDIHDVIIRDVAAHSQLCHILRLLACNCRIRNVIIDGITDTSPEGHTHWSCICIGEPDTDYGRNLPDGIRNVTISNILSAGSRAIAVGGYLKDSVISNVISRVPNAPVISVQRENGLTNVLTANLLTVQE